MIKGLNGNKVGSLALCPLTLVYEIDKAVFPNILGAGSAIHKSEIDCDLVTFRTEWITTSMH